MKWYRFSGPTQLSVFREHGIDDPLQIFAENNLHLPKIKSWQWFLSRTGHNTLLISQFCNCAYPFVHPRYLKHSNKTKFCNVQYMALKNRKVATLSKAVTKKFQHFSSRTPHHSKQYQSPPEGWFLFLFEKNNQESAHANLTHYSSSPPLKLNKTKRTISYEQSCNNRKLTAYQVKLATKANFTNECNSIGNRKL